MRKSLDNQLAMRCLVERPYCLTLLAEALLQVKGFQRRWRCVTKPLRLAARNKREAMRPRQIEYAGRFCVLSAEGEMRNDKRVTSEARCGVSLTLRDCYRIILPQPAAISDSCGAPSRPISQSAAAPATPCCQTALKLHMGRKRNLMTPELNREYPELDDPKIFDQMVNLTVGHMKPICGHIRRAQHAKATCCVPIYTRTESRISRTR